MISSGQNGPGTADVTTGVFDTYGNLIWSQDARGFIGYNGIDIATGAAVQSIADVNTASLGDLVDDVVPLPTGWSTPTGGGLNLVTSMRSTIWAARRKKRARRECHLYCPRRPRP